jgi:quercetin dioxygenase-like cupin family protein
MVAGMRLPAGLGGRVLLALLAITIVPAAATQVASQTPTPEDLDCEPAKRNEVLRSEQEAVLERLGDLRVVRNQADLTRLGGPPYNFPFPTHLFTSFRGIGFTLLNPIDPVRRGSPNFLFYAPANDAADVTDPGGRDFPYTLTGWGYGVPYAPEHLPGFLPCVGADDWHIHERGVHDFATGGMQVMPPAEAGFAESAGQLSDPPALRPVVGFPHARAWTAHFWLDGDDIPESAILDPTDPPPGINPGVGSSFYFPEEKPSGALDPVASVGRPLTLQAGEGTKAREDGNEFTLKVGSLFTGGFFNVIEAKFTGTGKGPSGGPDDQSLGLYVLSGQITFEAAGQTLPGERGSFAYVPPGTDFTYTVGGGGSARVLIVSAPGGLDVALELGPPSSSAPQSQSPEAAGTRPFVLRPGEGESVKVGDAAFTFKATASDTGGAFSVLEAEIPRGAQPAPHIHHREFEAFYMLSGEITFQVAGQTFPTQPGGFTFLPLGVLHFYSVDSADSRAVLVARPGGLESLFRRLSKTPAGQRPSIADSLKSGVEPVIPQSALGN